MAPNLFPRRAAIAVALALLIVLPAAVAARDGLPSVPADDFYQVAPVPAGPDGELLRSQELFAPDGLRLWAILYRSTGVSGEPVAVSGLLLAADEPAARPRPVLSIAHGTTGLADVCAPSRSPDKRLELIGAGIPAVNDGWVVVATDYQGLGTPGPHPYIDGPTEGRAVLHAIIAAGQVPEAGAGRRAAVQGISQGGHAALWAAQLAPEEAPGVDVAGVVAAAPAGDLRVIADWARSGDETRDSWQNTIAVATAWSQVYGLPLERLLTPAGVEGAARLETECRVTPDAQPLQLDEAIEDAWNERLEANSPGAARAPMPVLYLQGTEDEQIPLVSAQATLARLCAAGWSVDYRELEGVDHAGSLYGGARLAEARAWLRERLDGTAAPDTCATARR